MRLAVLASGSGSLLHAILEDDIPVDLVLLDRKCAAHDVATRHGVEVVCHERTSFGKSFDREGYTREVVDILRAHEIDLVAMAGYGTILSPAAVEAYQNRLLNTHPALLPAFKGWHGVRDALDHGVKVTGCTVMIATEEMDDGPILAQEPVRVLEDDTEETLHERIKEVERRLYPAAIRLALEDPSTLDRAAEARSKET